MSAQPMISEPRSKKARHLSVPAEFKEYIVVHQHDRGSRPNPDPDAANDYIPVGFDIIAVNVSKDTNHSALKFCLSPRAYHYVMTLLSAFRQASNITYAFKELTDIRITRVHVWVGQHVPEVGPSDDPFGALSSFRRKLDAPCHTKTFTTLVYGVDDTIKVGRKVTGVSGLWDWDKDFKVASRQVFSYIEWLITESFNKSRHRSVRMTHMVHGETDCMLSVWIGKKLNRRRVDRFD